MQFVAQIIGKFIKKAYLKWGQFLCCNLVQIKDYCVDVNLMLNLLKWTRFTILIEGICSSLILQSYIL